jgi:hypothetical protein
MFFCPEFVSTVFLKLNYDHKLPLSTQKKLSNANNVNCLCGVNYSSTTFLAFCRISGFWLENVCKTSQPVINITWWASRKNFLTKFSEFNSEIISFCYGNL